MGAILSITLPVFALIGIGYATTRGGLFTPADMRVLGKFTLNLALPALMFSAMATRDFAEVLHPTYLAAYALAGLALVGAGMLWFGRQGLDLRAAAAATMGTCCPNSGFIGYPAMLLAVPQVAVPALAMNVLVENLLVIPLLLALMQAGAGERRQRPGALLRRLAADLARRPLMVALAAGVVVSVAGLPVPQVVERVLAMIGAATGPVALIAIGGGLVGLPVRGQRALAAQIVAGKLIAQPLAAAGALALLVALGMAPLDPALRLALVLTAAVPMMSVWPLFAQEAGMEGVASLAMLAAVAGSFATLSLLVPLLG